MRPYRLLAALALLTATIAGPTSAGAQEPTVLPDPAAERLNAKVTHFLEAIAAHDEATAFSELLANSQLLQQTEAVRGLVEKAKEIESRYGKFREAEQIRIKRVGKDLILMRYLFKCESFPVVWYFSYYRDYSRPKSADEEQWVVIAVRFDTQLDLLGIE